MAEGTNPDGRAEPVAAYAWDWGDGTPPLTTPEPVATHVYAAPGPYPVTLTVTDATGTSTRQVSTGQTMHRNGGPSARRAATVTIPAVDAPVLVVANRVAGSAGAFTFTQDCGGETLTYRLRDGQSRTTPVTPGVRCRVTETDAPPGATTVEVVGAAGAPVVRADPPGADVVAGTGPVTVTFTTPPGTIVLGLAAPSPAPPPDAAVPPPAPSAPAVLPPLLRRDDPDG